jgi:hypothetical protein
MSRSPSVARRGFGQGITVPVVELAARLVHQPLHFSSGVRQRGWRHMRSRDRAQTENQVEALTFATSDVLFDLRAVRSTAARFVNEDVPPRVRRLFSQEKMKPLALVIIALMRERMIAGGR